MREVEDLRTKQTWTDFNALVLRAIKGEPRHALSQHVTQACQPKKEQGVAGPAGSLKASGADEGHCVDGVHQCRISLKNLLEPGDGICLNYVSKGHKVRSRPRKLHS